MDRFIFLTFNGLSFGMVYAGVALAPAHGTMEAEVQHPAHEELAEEPLHAPAEVGGDQTHETQVLIDANLGAWRAPNTVRGFSYRV